MFSYTEVVWDRYTDVRRILRGAAPIQNVGAYGMEIGQVIEKVSFFDLDKRTQGEFSREQREIQSVHY